MRWKRSHERVQLIVELDHVGVVGWLDELLEVMLQIEKGGIEISSEPANGGDRGWQDAR